MKKTALITGATSGLGLALVKQLIRHNNLHFILPVRDMKRGQQLKNSFSDGQQARIRLLKMDLSDLATVRAGTDSLSSPIDILMFNAGVQSAETTIYTKDKFEQTFAVNHLAHFVLLQKIEHLLTNEAIIGWVGSGTHHPELAKTFGFTGAHYRDPQLLAKGQYDSEPNTRQSSRDAYATSKGLNILMARYLASRNSSRTYFAFDPGLMAGTGLAREGSLGLRLAWKYVLPMVAKLMKGTSTPKRSAAMLARVLLRDQKIVTGSYMEYTGHSLEPFMPQDEAAYCQRIFDYSDRFVEPGD